MDNFEPARQRRIVNHLTAARLALQAAERWTKVTEQQRALLNTALAATSALAVELLGLGLETATRPARRETADDAVTEAVRRYAAHDGDHAAPDEQRPAARRVEPGERGPAEVSRSGLES